MYFPNRLIKSGKRGVILVVLVCFCCLSLLPSTSDKCDCNVEKSDPIWQRRHQSETRYLYEKENQSTTVTIPKRKLENAENRTGPSFNDTLVFPAPRREKVFLTIGIPTVKRKGASYLHQTISSLLDNMSPEEKKEVLIVVFLADTDPGIRQSLADEIKSHFKEYVETGMIHIIQAPATYYPDFDVTKNTYRQTQTYIRWRAKQCYDYAYMLEYSVDLSTYYMQLEDDVVTTKDYIGAIKEFMEEQPGQEWVCLEFSELGFIGKLYRSTDLKQLAALLKLFHIEQPADYTFVYFNVLNTQMSQRLRKPTLFQHKGTRSSSPRVIQRLKDRFYNGTDRRDKSNNPPADVYSTVEKFMTYFPHLAYESVLPDGYFWTYGRPEPGDTLTVVFHEPQRLKSVTVDTGADAHPQDTLHGGELLVGYRPAPEDKQKCLDLESVGIFVDGYVDVGDLEEKVKRKAACLVIKVTRRQRDWLIVKDIVVKVTNTTSEGNTTLI